MKRRLTTETATIKILVSYQIVCQTKSIIHQANIDCDITCKQKRYLASCETKFKERFGNHKKSLSHINHKNGTKLSK